jgi:hypothetical protein
VFVRVMMMRVKVLVNLDLAAEKANEDGEPGENKEATGSDVEGALPTFGEEVSSEVEEDSGDGNDDGVSGSEAHGKPDDAAEVVFDGDTEGGDGGEVIGADAVDESGNEDGE